MRADRFLSFIVLALAACSAHPPEPWQRVDGAPPTSSETSFCHNEARRQAGTLYPDRPPSDAVGQPRISDSRRFPAEIELYEKCMTRRGFVRASVRT